MPNTRHIRNFYTLIQKYDFQEYIGIPKKNGNNDIRIEIKLNNQNRQINLDIIKIIVTCRHKHQGFYFESLPFDINEIIDSYLYETLTLEFSIFINIAKLFSPPVWFLSNIDIAEEKRQTLSRYYTRKVNKHNKTLRHDDSWIIYGIDKHILHFFSTLEFGL